jgi:hypothetical protein
LWAFFCGVFTVYFGTSLLRIICGKIFARNLLVRLHYSRPCRCETYIHHRICTPATARRHIQGVPKHSRRTYSTCRIVGFYF